MTRPPAGGGHEGSCAVAPAAADQASGVDPGARQAASIEAVVGAERSRRPSTFVAHLGVDRRDTAIVRSIIALGRELDLSVIAEGVETEVQLEHLRLLGCRVAQGYLVARPAPAEEIDLRRAAREPLTSAG